MKNIRPRFLIFTFIFFTLLAGNRVYASHIVGVDLSYTYVSGNTYTINLVVYADCGAQDSILAQLLNATPDISIYDDASLVAANFYLTVNSSLSGFEIGRICPWDSTTCSSPSGTAPGIRKYLYSGSYTFPHTSAKWRCVFTANLGGGYRAGRSNACTNINNGSTVQMEALLNNTLSNNSNPILATDQPQYFCIYHDDSYNPAGTDPDSDSLYYELVPAMDASSGTAVAYLVPTSGTAPLANCTSSFLIDHATGILLFNPGGIQRDLVVYKISEYRHGVLVGTSQREMTALTLNCSASLCDTVTSVNQLNGDNENRITVFPNPSYGSFNISIPKHTTAVRLAVEDVLGKVILSKTISGSSENSLSITLSPATPPGTYFIKVAIAEKIYREKVVVW